MNYFPNRTKYVSPRGLLNDLLQIRWALVQAFRRTSSQIKGRKRLYASSLAFKTVLAIVPALAILMGVLAGDAFTQKREQLLDKFVDVIYPVETGDEAGASDPSEGQDLGKFREAGRRKIHNTVNHFARHAEKMGVAGLGAFAVVLFLLLRDVEDSFNFLWGVEKGRPFAAQVVRYGTLLLVAPFLAVLLLTLGGWVQGGALQRTWLGAWFFSSLVPFLCLWALCGWMYHWLPNAKARWKTSMMAGSIAALMIELGQWGMGWYTLHVVAGSRVYGALWMIPVMLLWFYVSWTIVLFGAEVAFFLQKGRDEHRR